MKKAFAFLFVISFVFVGYTFLTTGFFRVIEESSTNTIVARVPLKGAEDIVVDKEGLCDYFCNE